SSGGSVHPHARGEDAAVRLSHHGLYGSPPRTWGRPTRTRRECQGQRFTPTHVGKTLDFHEKSEDTCESERLFFFSFVFITTRARPSKSMSMRLLSPYWR